MPPRTNMRDARTLLTENEAAERLAITPRALQSWRVTGGGPVFIKIGRCVRYRLADLDAFIDAGERRSTSETAA